MSDTWAVWLFMTALGMACYFYGYSRGRAAGLRLTGVTPSVGAYSHLRIGEGALVKTRFDADGTATITITTNAFYFTKEPT